MRIRIELVTEKMYSEIYHFEMKNKAFFEEILPPRPGAYQQYDTFKVIMDSLLCEQREGQFYMYVIRDENDAFIGRLNLQMMHSEHSTKAELGYRVDSEKQGKGYTSQAIKLILKESFERYTVNEVIAGTSKDNIPSQRVLEKNGFKQIGEEKRVMKVNGKWVDGFLYAIQELEMI